MTPQPKAVSNVVNRKSAGVANRIRTGVMKAAHKIITSWGVVRISQNPKNQGIADQSSVSLEGHVNGTSIRATGTNRESSEAIRQLRDIGPVSNDETERRGVALPRNDGSLSRSSKRGPQVSIHELHKIA